MNQRASSEDTILLPKITLWPRHVFHITTIPIHSPIQKPNSKEIVFVAAERNAKHTEKSCALSSFLETNLIRLGSQGLTLKYFQALVFYFLPPIPRCPNSCFAVRNVCFFLLFLLQINISFFTCELITFVTYNFKPHSTFLSFFKCEKAFNRPLQYSTTSLSQKRKRRREQNTLMMITQLVSVLVTAYYLFSMCKLGVFFPLPKQFLWSESNRKRRKTWAYMYHFVIFMGG